MASGGGDRSEADRWLVTSEKLLAARDLQGAKTFAIRACEADPTRAGAADYILAISDTLIAGETLVNCSNLPDWYAVLRLVRLTQNPEHIATQYRRLALLLNPKVNCLSFADQAYKLVSDAWYVLSDPSRKSLYDRDLQLTQLGQPGSRNQQQQPRNFSGNSVRIRTMRRGGVGVWKTQTEPTASSFWTSCPYCFVLFEYSKGYEDCALRCQYCRRAFQAVTMQTPPVEGEGKDVYFCSWGVFPLGFSGHTKTAAWSPISPLFPLPGQRVSEQPTRKEPASPRIFYDDDDIYVELSEDEYEPEEDDDDEDWLNDESRNKKAKFGKGKGTTRKSSTKQRAEKAGRGSQNVVSISGVSNPTVSIAQDCSTSRKRVGTRAKNLGRLDLNVEFNNEVEEPSVAGRKNDGNGLRSSRDDDNIEGNGFFEGLDEFLSSLPILSVVEDDKVKAT
ncbi:PREDICTED: uncharacterized protein LOC104819327 [Tarenaya hassleriana]|uniref:uncharacterized protein LOC104819327 n=1 Tax=Tarenaya hassleriana TaxID=28532 RepID=UPI00053C4BB7|nr:PREDICTED: uncharacterized protein LOC104819327 [Tarenaya hassleriana]